MNETSKKIGIQGGRGSFNEQAALRHLASSGFPNFQLHYLHTTENVLNALDAHNVDLGQFAIRNSLGGDVEESVKAMKGRQISIVNSYTITISHTLMISPAARLSDITTIITHPQVLRQCAQTLKKNYGHIKLDVCDGDLVDPAKVAELLSSGKLPKTVATVSNKLLAQIHNLTVVAEDLQDSDENYTTFLLVERAAD